MRDCALTSTLKNMRPRVRFSRTSRVNNRFLLPGKSYQMLSKNSEKSARFLDMLGIIHHASIPKTFIRRLFENRIGTKPEFLSALGMLLNFSLINRERGGEKFWIHPLVHTWIVSRLDERIRNQNLRQV